MMAWDVTRRDLLGVGAMGAATFGLAGLRGPVSDRSGHLTLVVETAVPESRQFADAIAETGWSRRILRIDRSLNGLLDELKEPTGLVAGLTSDPAAMIAGQLLAERGARERLLWQHHYSGGRWRHSIESAPLLLKGTSVGWPVAVAHHLRDAMTHYPGGARSICHSNECALAAGSPGMLVSWAYEIERSPS